MNLKTERCHNYYCLNCIVSPYFERLRNVSNSLEITCKAINSFRNDHSTFYGQSKIFIFKSSTFLAHFEMLGNITILRFRPSPSKKTPAFKVMVIMPNLYTRMGRVATITASSRNIERPEEASDLRLPRGRRCRLPPPVTGLVKVRQAWPRSFGACESAALLPVTTPLRPQKRSQPAPPQLPSPILGPTLQ